MLLENHFKIRKNNNERLLLHLICLAVFVVYLPILDNDFSSRDDGWMLYTNEQVFSLEWSNIFEYFTSITSGQYSPLNTFYYSVIYYFFELKPFWYYLGNLLIHILNINLVYYFIKRLLRLNDSNNVVYPQSNISYIALGTAFLFGVHPMQVESVGWISASKILIFSFFFLLGFNTYLRYIETRKWKYFLWTIVLFILSFLSKEQAVVFPLCLLLIDYFVDNKKSLVQNLIEKIPFFVLSLFFTIFSWFAQNTGFHDKLTNEYYPAWQRLFLACYSYNEYFLKILVPINLSKFYRFPMAVGEPFPFKYWWYPILVPIVGCSIIWSHLQKRKIIVFCIGFFTINILLTLHIIPMGRNSLMADRYVYVGIIGIAILVLRSFLRYLSNLRLTKRKLAIGGLAIYMIALFVYTLWRTVHWS